MISLKMRANCQVIRNYSFLKDSILQRLQKKEENSGECKKIKPTKTEEDCEFESKLIAEPSKLDPKYPQPSVVIVGAGMAGLSAAHRLVECGLTDVTVIEALDRPGGRIHTCSLSKTPVEMGALWLEGCCIANPLFNLACQEGLLTVPLNRIDPMRGFYFNSEGKVISEKIILQAFNKYNKIKHRAEDAFYASEVAECSLKGFMKKEIDCAIKLFPIHERCDVSNVMHSLTNELVERWGDSLARLSAKQYGNYVRIPGGSTYFPRGYVEILKPLIRTVTEKRIKYEKVAKVIRWSPVGSCCSRVVVKCCDGDEFGADYIIVTVSLGVLKSNHDYLFFPKLPSEKIEAIEKLGYGLVNRVFFEYAKPFWLHNEGCVRPAWSEEELKDRSEWVKSIAILEESPASSNVLMFSIGGCEAFCVESLAEGKIVQEGTNLLRRLMRNSAIPFPKATMKSSWFTNQYFKGSNSYMNLESTTEHIGALSAPLSSNCPALFFAGEATVPGYFSTVQGARLSGIREAERILQMTRSLRGPPKYEIPVCTLP